MYHDDADRLLPPPNELGLPEKFSEWRSAQDRAIFDVVEAETRFVMSVAPTGFGKTVFYMALAKLLGGRACIVTHTKALQAQIESDFRAMGIRTISGMNAYRCLALEPSGELYRLFDQGERRASTRARGCDEGPCRVGAECSLRAGGCTYYDAVKHATYQPLVVTNYATLLYQGTYGQGLGTFGLLVLDEAHGAPRALSDFLTVDLRAEELRPIGATFPVGSPAPDQWRTWATHHAQKAGFLGERLGAEIRDMREKGDKVPRALFEEARQYIALASKLKPLTQIDHRWVSYPKEQGRWVFTPAWPSQYAERHLFRGVPKVVLTSATVRRKTAQYLGIPSGDLTVHEYPSTFPKQRRPIMHVPVFLPGARKPIRLTHKSTQEEFDRILAVMDEIIADRLDRKGLIHTVSYPRARQVMVRSAFREYMIPHTSDTTRLAIERFREAPSPSILVSPSVSEGYDFPFDLCEYIIILKVPFPDQRDPVLQARLRLDPDYGNYEAMQTLVQQAGRGMRAEDDACETFILDAQIQWFAWKHAALAPRWFLDTLQRRFTLPPAPPKLQRS